jgi:biotin carboxyl carrier protein
VGSWSDEEEEVGDLNSPISGRIVKVSAQVGQHLDKGATILVIEAMTLEYEVRTPFAGTVTHIHFSQSDPVEIGQTLAEMDADPEDGGEEAGSGN